VGHNAFGPANNWHAYSLILRKISKTGATRCQILRPKFTKFAPPNPVAVFKGLTSKGREEKKGEEGEGKER